MADAAHKTTDADAPASAPLTEREIQQRVDRMLGHLDRLLLNDDLTSENYVEATLELFEWELRAKSEAR